MGNNKRPLFIVLSIIYRLLFLASGMLFYIGMSGLVIPKSIGLGGIILIPLVFILFVPLLIIWIKLTTKIVSLAESGRKDSLILSVIILTTGPILLLSSMVKHDTLYKIPFFRDGNSPITLIDKYNLERQLKHKVLVPGYIPDMFIPSSKMVSNGLYENLVQPKCQSLSLGYSYDDKSSGGSISLDIKEVPFWCDVENLTYFQHSVLENKYEKINMQDNDKPLYFQNNCDLNNNADNSFSSCMHFFQTQDTNLYIYLSKYRSSELFPSKIEILKIASSFH